MKFSLVIPCYNEANSIKTMLEQCRKLTTKTNTEIVIVNNGSTDNSSKVIAEEIHKYPNCRAINIKKNHGYGAGIIQGLQSAKGDVIGWTHADMQTDPMDAIYAIKLFKKHGENIFVKGKRYGRPFSDTFFTIGMSIFETMLLAKPMHDINAQPTMFSREFFQCWKNPPKDFALDLYAYYYAHKKKLKVHRFPVQFSKRKHGVSHWNINWKAKLKFIIRTLKFSLILKKNIEK